MYVVTRDVNNKRTTLRKERCIISTQRTQRNTKQHITTTNNEIWGMGCFLHVCAQGPIDL